MTATTGLSLFHLSHGGPFVFLPVRPEHSGVAIFTTVHLSMKSVTERRPGNRWSAVCQFGTAVAFAAFIDVKGLFAIVT